MSREAVVSMEGAKRLRSTLRKAGVKLTELTAAHKEAAQKVTPVAKARAPRRSGRLASSGRPGATSASALIRFGGATVPYAGVIHFGWPAHNITAQPFAYEAAVATQSQWEPTYRRHVDDVLKTVKGI